MTGFFAAALALIMSISGTDTLSITIPENWQPVKDKTYVGGALYGYMNGGSDEYYDYGFRGLRVLTLSSGGHEYTVELFRMDTPENAHGIYLQHTFKPLRENALEMADYDFLSKYQLQAVSGCDYISIIFDDGPEAAPGADAILSEYLSFKGQHHGHRLKTNPEENHCRSDISGRIAANCKIISLDTWHGFNRTVFEFEGHKAWVVEPSVAPKEGNPWTWTMQWADAFVDRTGVLDLIAEGWYHVTIDIYEERGNDESMRVAADFQKFLVEQLGLASRTRLVGMSWGGFFSVRYAALYPRNVSRIYLDAPLLMFGESFSQGLGWWEDHKPADGDWSRDPRMPLNMASIIASEQIPVLLLYGGQDQTVDPKVNCEPFIEEMKARGGNITVHKRDAFGHHPHGVDPDKTAEITVFLAGEQGKNLFTLFDSLGQTGVWQSRLAELSGMNFDADLNFNYFCPHCLFPVERIHRIPA